LGLHGVVAALAMRIYRWVQFPQGPPKLMGAGVGTQERFINSLAADGCSGPGSKPGAPTTLKEYIMVTVYKINFPIEIGQDYYVFQSRDAAVEWMKTNHYIRQYLVNNNINISSLLETGELSFQPLKLIVSE